MRSPWKPAPQSSQNGRLRDVRLTAAHALGLTLMIAGLAVWPSAAGAKPSRCAVPGAEDFVCAKISVPLDREGIREGRLSLRYAVEPASRRKRGVLIALSGGPGQSSVPAAGSFAEVLRPALGRDRLAVLDQRGTGAGALRCPSLQNLGGVDTVTAKAVKACAARLGPRAADYTTADSVADIEALRKRLGVTRISLMGVSYGTYVAVQYARSYPKRVKRLILDSPLGPDGLDAFLLDSFAPMVDVVSGWCRRIACPANARQPWENLAAVVQKIRSGGLAARLYRPSGRGQTSTLKSELQLLNLIWSADLNPALQALLPSALAAAAGGDGAPLLRLFSASGEPFKASELSAGLNEATLCADIRFPFAPADDVPTRLAKNAAALSAIASGLYAPFSKAVVNDISLASDCVHWPVLTGVAAAATGPLPDVPALILSGSFDQRTPTAGAVALASRFKRASLVRVPGTGHDTIDSDASGCVATALRRFSSGRAVGSPCASSDNRWVVQRRSPTSLRSTAPIGNGGTTADRRLLAAVALTVSDSRFQVMSQLYSGMRRPRGGGLRGGRFVMRESGIHMYRYMLVRGVRVSGSEDLGLRIAFGRGRRATATVSLAGTVVLRTGGRRSVATPGYLRSLMARPPREQLTVGAAAAQLSRR